MRFQLYQGRRPLLQDYLASVLGQRPLRRDVWALRDVTLSVRRGEVFGLVGSNGSGKSTLLKVIARILRPTSGRVVVYGHVAPLIELGAGFQPDLTGRENVLLKSAILGHRERDTRQRMAQIVDFAGLHEFIDAPLHTYSSGMVARLAFAVATDVQPDILIIDEVLAVGDAEFRERSEQRVADLRRAGTTILVVSHNSATLRRMCDRIGWLAYGRLQMLGDVAEVVGAYEGGLGRAPTDAAEDGPAAGGRAPHRPAGALQADQTLFVLETPGAAAPAALGAIEAHFDQEHIAPFRAHAELPAGARMALAPYRLVRGAFFFDQMAQLLQQAPVCATFLRAPGAHPHQSAAADNPVTRLLGQRMPSESSAPDDAAYLATPVGREDFSRARAVLDSLAMVGLAERSRETLLLLWYTFGWAPDQALLLAQPPSGPSDSAAPGTIEAQERDRYDAALYAHACRLFDQRLALMTRDIVERYGHMIAGDLAPPLPPELYVGLLRLHHEWCRAERGGPRALRFTFDRPVPGTGWYGVEYNQQHGTFRWTGPDRRATLQLPIEHELAACPLVLRCRLLLASRPAVQKSLRFFVNDQPIPVTQTRMWDGSTICEGPVPATALIGSSFARIALEVERTAVPSSRELAHQETRHLGVALSWIELAPAETAPGQEVAALAAENA